MTTRPPAADTGLPSRGGGEVEVALHGSEPVDALDFGWIFDTDGRTVVGLYAANPTPDSFYIMVEPELDFDQRRLPSFRIDLAPGDPTKQRIRFPAARRIGTVVVDKRGVPEEVVPYGRLVIERVYTNPRRSSPVVLSVTHSQSGNNSQTHNHAMPAVVATNDLLVILHNTFHTFQEPVTHTTPADWSLETSAAAAGSGDDARCSIYTKDAVGDEDGTNVNVASSANDGFMGDVFRIEAGSWDGTLGSLDEFTPVTGGSGGLNLGVITAAGGAGNHLVIVMQGIADNVGTGGTPQPAGYTLGNDADLNGVEDGHLTTAYLILAGTDTENPAAFGRSFSGTAGVALGVLVREAAGGGAITPTGSVTPTGDPTLKLIRGVAGGTTPAGGVDLRVIKPFAGSATPAGARSQRAIKPVAGSTTPSGVLTRKTSKPLLGTITPTGNLIRLLHRAFTGTTTPVGVAVVFIKRVIALAGSITPTGARSQRALLRAGGSATPSGSVTRETHLEFDAETTPTGQIIRQIHHTTAGEVDPTGTITRDTAAHRAGSIGPTGVLTRALSRAVTGSTTPTGGLTRRILKRLAGAVTPSGELTIQVAGIIQRFFSGTITPAGTILRDISRRFTGQTTPTGHYGPQIVHTRLDGATTPTGTTNLIRRLARAFSGSATPIGVLTRRITIRTAGDATPTGSLTRAVSRAVTGSIIPAGAVAKTIRKALTGQISATASLVLELLETIAGAVVFRITHQGRTTTHVETADGGAIPHQGISTTPIPGPDTTGQTV